MEMTKGRRWSLLVAAVDVIIIVVGIDRRPAQLARPIFGSLLICLGLMFIWYPRALARLPVSWISPVGRFWENLHPGFVSLIGWMWMILAVPFIAILAPG